MTPEWFTWESAGFIRSFHFPALSRLLNRLYSSHSPGLLIWNIYSSEMMGQQIQYTHILFYHNFPGLYSNRKEFLWVLDTYLISWKRASVRGLVKFWAIFLRSAYCLKNNRILKNNKGQRVIWRLRDRYRARRESFFQNVGFRKTHLTCHCVKFLLLYNTLPKT